MVLDQFSPWMENPANPLSDPVILDALLEASVAPACVLDTALNFVRFNRAAAEATRTRRGKELRPGLPFADIFPEGEFKDIVLEHTRAALSGVTKTMSVWLETMEGGRVLREIRRAPIRGDDGAIIGVLITTHDPPTIAAPRSDHPEAGIEYGALFHDAPVAMLLARLDGTITVANKAFCSLLGYPQEELVGKSMPEITWAEDRGISPLRALADGNLGRYRVLKRYRHADGSPVPVVVSAVRLNNVEPPLIHAMAEPAEGYQRPAPHEGDAASVHSALAAAAFESQLDGVILLDPNGRILDVNPAFAAMERRTREGCRGLTPLDFEAIQSGGEVARTLAEATHGPIRFQSIHRRPDGTTLPVAVALTPMTVEGANGFCCTVRDMTSETALLDERNKSGTRYQQMVERSPNITYTFSTHRGGLYYSPQVEQVLGYSPEELVRAPFRWVESVHPEDRAKVDQALATMEREGGFDVELRVRHKNGSWRWLREWSASVERVGEELVVTGQALDLTPLREQEQRFQRLVENVPDMLYRWSANPTPHFNYVSAAVHSILGYLPSEIEADASIFQSAVFAEDWDRVSAARADAARDRDSFRLRARHRDGSLVWLDVRRTVIRDRDGGVIATEGIARDVTAAVEAETRNALLSAGLEQAAEVVMITDAAGRIVEVNSAFERVTGYARGEVLGRNPSLLKSGFQGADFYAKMWQTLTAGEIFRGTVINRKKDGSNYVAEVVVTPIRGATGDIVNYVGLQRDVSRERLLDEALRQSQKMDAVGQVTGGVAHDFNNMLTVILANANLLEEKLEPGSEAAGTLHEMVAAAQHGTGLVRQLLAFGRKEHLSPRPIRLTDEFSHFVSILRRALSENIEIAFAGTDVSWANVDRTAFEQMLLNLATNARDAMQAGGRLTVRTGDRLVTESEAAVAAGERAPGRYTTISVTDTGQGMTPDVVRRVVEPFFTTKPVGKGTGLGMSMVYGLMKQHGGWVEIESTVGVGTTVTLGFPVVPAPPSQATAETAAPVSGSSGRGELILVVEDEPALRRVAVRSLQREGYKVTSASDGEAGWSQWQQHGDEIALILTDAIMPKLGGGELIRRLRTSGCTVPVILMSGYSAEDLTDPLFKDVPVVAKPWSGEALGRRIREVLDGLKMDG